MRGLVAINTPRLGRTSWALLVVTTLVAACLLLAARPAYADTFTVNSTGDAGDLLPGNGSCYTGNVLPGAECTLRAAIEEANTNNNDATVVDAINFNIGGSSGVKTISPASSLPIITEPVTIDGYSEPGASENTRAVGNDAVLLIRLDGTNAPTLATGLGITADNSEVRGLSITRFSVGIRLDDADNNTVEGNFVGISPGGQDMGNEGGLSIFNGSSDNLIGGSSADARNIISGNDAESCCFQGNGINISGTGTVENMIQGNYIGTTKSGTGDLGNDGWGVSIRASGNLVGDNDTSDGLTNAANIIAFNGLYGVTVNDIFNTGDPILSNSILSNSIFSNAVLGIDLGHDGVTPNDGPGDVDEGPNNLQNYPVISSARTSRKGTIIKGTLESTQNALFALQFFKNPKGTRDEGKKYIGQIFVSETDGDGIMPFTVKPTKKVKEGMFVTATATNVATGDTSEFSAQKKVR